MVRVYRRSRGRKPEEGVRYRGYFLWYDAALDAWLAESAEGLDDADAGAWPTHAALLAAIDESHRASGEAACDA